MLSLTADVSKKNQLKTNKKRKNLDLPSLDDHVYYLSQPECISRIINCHMNSKDLQFSIFNFDLNNNNNTTSRKKRKISINYPKYKFLHQIKDKQYINAINNQIVLLQKIIVMYYSDLHFPFEIIFLISQFSVGFKIQCEETSIIGYNSILSPYTKKFLIQCTGQIYFLNTSTHCNECRQNKEYTCTEPTCSTNWQVFKCDAIDCQSIWIHDPYDNNNICYGNFVCFKCSTKAFCKDHINYFGKNCSQCYKYFCNECMINYGSICQCTSTIKEWYCDICSEKCPNLCCCCCSFCVCDFFSSNE